MLLSSMRETCPFNVGGFCALEFNLQHREDYVHPRDNSNDYYDPPFPIDEKDSSDEVNDDLASAALNPVVRTLLAGMYDPKCSLHILKSHSEIWKIIWKGYIVPGYKESIFRHPGLKIQHLRSRRGNEVNVDLPYALINVVKFPKPTDINVNMMPFDPRNPEKTLPKSLHGYLPVISACSLTGPGKRIEDVVYLTVQESYVQPNQPQRRGGMHTDRPGEFVEYSADGKSIFKPAYGSRWGCGLFRGRKETFLGGLYMASTVSGSCQVWPAKIKKTRGVVGPHGECEHLSEWCGEPEKMSANYLYWLTDMTPHESLPLPGGKGGYRQFFRLVTGELSAWYEQHSTANPLGVMPKARIIKGSKFSSSVETKQKSV